MEYEKKKKAREVKEYLIVKDASECGKNKLVDDQLFKTISPIVASVFNGSEIPSNAIFRV